MSGGQPTPDCQRTVPIDKGFIQAAEMAQIVPDTRESDCEIALSRSVIFIALSNLLGDCQIAFVVEKRLINPVELFQRVGDFFIIDRQVVLRTRIAQRKKLKAQVEAFLIGGERP